MEEATGTYTQENENFCRYFRLVNETGPKVLRQVLISEAKPMSVQDFLRREKRKLKHLRCTGVLHKEQFTLIFPADPTTFSLESWDITLLSMVIDNLCSNLPSIAVQTVKEVRQSRNAINHNPTPVLTGQEFDDKWRNYTDALKVLLSYCNDNDLEKQFLHEIQTIHSSPLSHAPVLEVFYSFAKDRSETIEQMRKFQMIMNHMQEKLEDNYATFDEAMRTMHVDIRTAYAQVMKLGQMDEDLHPAIRILHDQTNTVLNKKEPYVETEQMLAAEHVLQKEGFVVISGGPGEGKTVTALEIMRRHNKDKKCIQIYNVSEIHKLKPNQFEIVFIDDIFGSREIDESKVKAWLSVLEKLQNLVNANAFKLIFTMRNLVLQDFRRRFPLSCKLFADQKNICLESQKLSLSEKEQILTRALQNYNRTLDSSIILNCSKCYKSSLGFPYMCLLFASNEEFLREGKTFFTKRSLDQKIIPELEESKRLALMYLWTTGSARLSRHEENDTLLRELSRKIGYETAIDIMYSAISEQLQIMNRIFVNCKEDTYHFAHNSIYESVGFYLSRVGLIEKVIKCCNLDFFMECVAVQEDFYRSDIVYLRKEHYSCLADRIITEVTENHNVDTVSLHTCLNSIDFLKTLLGKLKKTKQIKQFLTSRCAGEYVNDPNEDLTFLASFLEKGCKSSTWFLCQVLKEFNRCNIHKPGKKAVCKTCEIYRCACIGACRGGNMEALQLLEFVKLGGRFLIEAARSRNPELFIKIVSKANQVDIETNKLQALHIAVENGDLEMYHTIRKHTNCSPDSTCLLAAHSIRNVKLIVQIIDNLRAADLLHGLSFEPILNSMFSIDIFDAFTLASVAVTKHHIIHAIVNDFKLVEPVLWNLRDPRHCTEVAKMARHTLWKELICDDFVTQILMKHGVINTKEYIILSIKGHKKEDVIDRVEKLITFDRFDQDSKMASGFLNEALSCYEIFEYLLTKGIKPTYQTLQLAVSHGSKFSVVQPILSRLKTDQSFDCQNKTLRRAFLTSVYDIDIYRLFVQAGMRPSAYHFLYVAERYTKETRREALSGFRNILEVLNKTDCLDKEIMNRVYLCVMDDEEVCVCLKDGGMRFTQNILPLLCEKNRINQIRSLVNQLKEDKKWPLSEYTIEACFKSSFYREETFNYLVEVLGLVSNCCLYRVLLAARQKDLSTLAKVIQQLRSTNSWQPDNIVPQVALLENYSNENVASVLKENGVSVAHILQQQSVLNDNDLQAYIMAHLSNTELTSIQYSSLDTTIICSMSSYPKLCNQSLIERAVEVGALDDLKAIIKRFKQEYPGCLLPEWTAKILMKCVHKTNFYEFLLKEGFVPDNKCLLYVTEHQSLKIYDMTILSMKSSLIPVSTKILEAAVLRKDVRFYTRLNYLAGIQPTLCHILLALKKGGKGVVKFLIRDVDVALPSESGFVFLDILDQERRMLYILYRKGFRLNPALLLLATERFKAGCMTFSLLKEMWKVYFYTNKWMADDETFLKIEKLSQPSEELHKLLSPYIFAAKVLHLLNTVLTNESEKVRKALDLIGSDSKVVYECIRQTFILNQSLSTECMKILYHFIDIQNFDASTRVMRLVMENNLDKLFHFLVNLTLKEERALDITIIQTVLEEAISKKDSKMFCLLCDTCQVEPTTYCLMHALNNGDEKCVDRVIRKLSDTRKTTADPFFKATLSLCCMKNDLERLHGLLQGSVITDAELLYDTVLLENKRAFFLVRQFLEQNGVWSMSNDFISNFVKLCHFEGLEQIKELISEDEYNNVSLTICKSDGLEQTKKVILEDGYEEYADVSLTIHQQLQSNSSSESDLETKDNYGYAYTNAISTFDSTSVRDNYDYAYTNAISTFDSTSVRDNYNYAYTNAISTFDSTSVRNPREHHYENFSDSKIRDKYESDSGNVYELF